jgi:hypothetical protein
LYSSLAVFFSSCVPSQSAFFFRRLGRLQHFEPVKRFSMRLLALLIDGKLGFRIRRLFFPARRSARAALQALREWLPPKAAFSWLGPRHPPSIISPPREVLLVGISQGN